MIPDDFTSPILPDTVTVLTGDRLARLNRISGLSFPGLEAVVASQAGQPATIWGLLGGPTALPDGRVAITRGVTWVRDGRVHIGLDVASNPCPLHRLAVVGHEARHLKRGDHVQPPTGDRLAEAEADCRAVATDLLMDMAGAVRHRTGVGIDPGICRTCYADCGGLPCQQGAAVFAAVEQALGTLTAGVVRKEPEPVAIAEAVKPVAVVGLKSRGVLHIGPAWEAGDQDRRGLVRIQEAAT